VFEVGARDGLVLSTGRRGRIAAFLVARRQSLHGVAADDSVWNFRPERM